MAVAEQEFARSEMTLRQTGYMALIQSFGYADVIRFLLQLSGGEGDYLEWQDRLFGDTSVDELYEQAQKHWQCSQTWISRTVHQHPSAHSIHAVSPSGGCSPAAPAPSRDL